ncbi:MAG: four helix bundle protein [Holophagaceae bacterium]|nr:four helix bundle protein [Holophagaceae bacterium]
MQRFTELKVWQRSQALVLKVYKTTASNFPSDERFGLTSQLRRAAVSIPCNIAEGSKRRTNRDYAHFLNMAEASLTEVECIILIARDLDYITPHDAESLILECMAIARMLHALRLKVEPITK